MHTNTRVALRVTGALVAIAAVTSGCSQDTGTGAAGKGVSPPRSAHGLGDIIVGGQAVTGSEPSHLAKVPYQRTYTNGPLYAPVTGYRSMVYGNSGLEAVYDHTLGAGAAGAAPGNVTTTVEPALQKAAFDALGDQQGAAVALDADSGELLAVVSTPSYDPARFSGRGAKDAQAWKAATTDSRSPMLNRALKEPAAPGATFSVVVAAAALEQKLYTTVDGSTVSPLTFVLPLSTTRVTGTSPQCENASIRTALRRSCANVFVKMAADMGLTRLGAMAGKFGFNDDTLKVPLSVAESSYPTVGTSSAGVALTGIGAGEVRATPLAMARVVAAVANGGRLVPPQLVKRVTDADGSTHRPPEAEDGRSTKRAISRGTADALREVIGRNGQSGWTVGGKGESATSWFIGCTDAPGGRRTAVAVRIEGLSPPSGGDDGGHEAAEVARKILASAS
ncbi:penicillin-binding transpeptidase domain-containing protein [Streptomyces sp. NPDC015139]|uniref:penicillin-binding transpeptidase domain-containing protein n=1 Tax=Streptomyces sp. NPDC015139 TaxID=3364942 RepID=UPI0036FB8791